MTIKEHIDHSVIKIAYVYCCQVQPPSGNVNIIFITLLADAHINFFPPLGEVGGGGPIILNTGSQCYSRKRSCLASQCSLM